MKKELSVRQLLIDVLQFIGNNAGLLGCLAVLSFAGSYISLYVGGARTFMFLLFYGLFIYCFYYLFICLYFDKKPIFTAPRFVNSFFKILAILALSFFILLFAKIGLNVTHYLTRGLAVFPDLYHWLKSAYYLFITSPLYALAEYLSVILLLTFSFFIPGFAWMSVIEKDEGSVIAAYSAVRGNYLKTAMVFVALYGLLPLLVGSVGLMVSRGVLAFLYALQTVFQLVVYLHLYDFYFKKCD